MPPMQPQDSSYSKHTQGSLAHYMKILNHTLMHPSYNKSLTLTIAIQHKASRRRQALKELKAKTQEWIPTRARGNEDSSHHALNI